MWALVSSRPGWQLLNGGQRAIFLALMDMLRLLILNPEILSQCLLHPSKRLFQSQQVRLLLGGENE